MTELTVIAPGARVQLGSDSDTFEGIVTAVKVEMNGRILYCCSWWSGRDLKDMWIEAQMVKAADADAPPLAIGFGRA